MSHLMIHNVAKVEMVSRAIYNSNARTICITDDEGVKFELTLFGETDVLDSLPRSAGFVEHFKDFEDFAVMTTPRVKDNDLNEITASACCERCQGNGEIVTDWDRYLKPREGDIGDEAVSTCPDCQASE